MHVPGLLWRERQSDSPLVESVWSASALASMSRTVIADPCISIALIETEATMQVVVMGPKTQPYSAALAPGYVCTTIRLKPGVFFKGLSTQLLTNTSLTFPANQASRFWFEGIHLQFPSFDQAERLVDELYKKDRLEYEDPNNNRMLSFRTYSRHLQRVTGLSPYQLFQLTRMHKALRLLKQGTSAVDVAAELAFVDQSHLIRASKRFLGHTPKHFPSLPQVP